MFELLPPGDGHWLTFQGHCVMCAVGFRFRVAAPSVIDQMTEFDLGFVPNDIYVAVINGADLAKCTVGMSRYWVQLRQQVSSHFSARSQ